jgi:hypothetical protein
MSGNEDQSAARNEGQNWKREKLADFGVMGAITMSVAMVASIISVVVFVLLSLSSF